MHALIILTTFRTPEYRRKFSSFVAGILCLVFGWTSDAQPTEPAQNPSQQIYDKMTPAQRVGQLFIWTYPGTQLTVKAQKWLARYQPGALIVFSRNIKSPNQIGKLNSDLQKFAKAKLQAPFFLMIDQEGGTVTRLKSGVPLPSALSVGRLNDIEFTKKYGAAVADLIKGFGFNVNLAPVMDISNPEKDTFIGSRSFGDDPEKVSQIAGAFAEGLSARGILPTAKHFPGHGGVIQDSHRSIPRKLSDYEQISDKDYVPFEEFAQNDLPHAVMMGHLSVPKIDTSGLPATYSKMIIHDHLRVKLKYKGLIITDDLEMNGASIGDRISERAVKAFIAGNDMLMFAGTLEHQKSGMDGVMAALKSGRITEDRLKESVLRILNAKADLKIGEFTYDSEKARDAITTTESLSRQVLKRNLKTALNTTRANWPSITPQTNVLVASSDARIFNSFKKIFKGKAKYYPLNPKTVANVEAAISENRFQFAVYYVSGIQTARRLNRLKPEVRAKVIVINTNHPGEIDNRGSYLAVLNVNSHNPESGGPLGEFLNRSGPELRSPAKVSKNSR